MASKTTIFISSSAQFALKNVRKTLFEFLGEELGHEPVMFEENFGAWPNALNNTAKCLEKVRECDVLLLMLSNRAGRYLEADDHTVTHLEFLEAMKEQKETLIFVKDEIASEFFGGHQIKFKMDAAISQYCEQHKQNPASIFKEIVLPMQDQLPKEVDPYTWVFLYDIVARDIYFEQFSEAVDFKEKLAEMLSDLLRQGLRLLPLKAQIDELPDQDHLDEVHELQMAFFHEMTIESFTRNQWERILPVLRDKLRNGGVISQQKGAFYTEPIVSYRGCSAISLYKHNVDMMELVAKDGLLGGKDFYLLEADKESSYIVQAYLMPDDEKPRIWYREDKKTIYLVIRVEEYVLCHHFILEKKIPLATVVQHTDDFICGIMGEQGDFIGIVQLVLGGMKHVNS